MHFKIKFFEWTKAGLIGPVFFISFLSLGPAFASIFEHSEGRPVTRDPRASVFDSRSLSVGFLTTEKSLKRKFLSSSVTVAAVAPLSKRLGLCSTEPIPQFFDTTTAPAARCTVFAISSKIVLTASHCFETLKCSEARIVMNDLRTIRQTGNGSRVDSGSTQALDSSNYMLSTHEVYKCRRLKRGQFLNSPRSVADRKGDWALVELDRALPINRTPLVPSPSRGIDNSLQGMALESLNFMMSQSLKLYSGEIEKQIENGQILETSLTASDGSSGAPVFRRGTHEVIGIVVSGGRPVVPDQNLKTCNTLVTCSASQLYRDDLNQYCFPTRVVRLTPEMLKF